MAVTREQYEQMLRVEIARLEPQVSPEVKDAAERLIEQYRETLKSLART